MQLPILEARGISYQYPDGTQALKEVSVKVYKGEVLGIVGPNGSGKSTLLMVLAGLLKPQQGRLLYKGAPIDTLDSYSYRRSVAIVFQNPDDQLLCTTVEEELLYSLRQLNLSPEEAKLRAESLANHLSIAHLAAKSPFKLSGGEKRKVLLAAILALNPEVLLLDEPTAELPPKAIEHLKHLILQINRQGKTVVIASHNIDFIAETCHRLYLLSQGQVIAEGLTREILANPNLLEKADLSCPTPTAIYYALQREINPPPKTPPLTTAELIELLREHLGNGERLKRESS